tara:strand:- start:1520 stop:2395 length:876 start_codon:yes stop_codon:yes gene_type:complete
MKFNYKIKILPKDIATIFVQKYHYSPVMPSVTKYYLGYYLDKKLVGVLTLGWGTRPRHTFNKMFPKVNILEKEYNKFVNDINDWYYEIGKMCLTPEFNNTKGAGSQMVSATIRWLKENTNCLFLYTMADGIMGKCGYVYQASNFYYGEKYWTQVYLMDNGEKLHPRSSNTLCKENAKFLVEKHGKGYLEKKYSADRNGDRYPRYFTTDFMLERGITKIDGLMFRYIYPLTKKAKKMLKDSSMNWTREYPKDKDLEWKDITDKKNTKIIGKPAFTYDYAKYNAKYKVAVLPI